MGDGVGWVVCSRGRGCHSERRVLTNQTIYKSVIWERCDTCTVVNDAVARREKAWCNFFFWPPAPVACARWRFSQVQYITIIEQYHYLFDTRHFQVDLQSRRSQAKPSRVESSQDKSNQAISDHSKSQRAMPRHARPRYVTPRYATLRHVTTCEAHAGTLVVVPCRVPCSTMLCSALLSVLLVLRCVKLRCIYPISPHESPSRVLHIMLFRPVSFCVYAWVYECFCSILFRLGCACACGCVQCSFEQSV